ncbi:MAG: regulatory protein FmdB family [Phycisphaerales bacterium]|nr:regulatory protein FmdB family [Phycisphaerales bacterium]
MKDEAEATSPARPAPASVYILQTSSFSLSPFPPMPTYEYECDACGHKFEKFHSMSAAPIKTCPACGKDTVRRLIGAGAGLIFKGSGFYITDYREAGYKDQAKAESGGGDKPASDNKGGEGKGGDGKSGGDAGGKSGGSDKPAESKPAAKTESSGSGGGSPPPPPPPPPPPASGGSAKKE